MRVNSLCFPKTMFQHLEDQGWKVSEEGLSQSEILEQNGVGTCQKTVNTLSATEFGPLLRTLPTQKIILTSF